MKKETITGLYKAPGKKAEARVIPNTLEALQELVGGYIEAVTAPIGSGCIFICNEEGKLRGMDPNFYYRGDMLVGPVFICCRSGEDFSDLQLRRGFLRPAAAGLRHDSVDKCRRLYPSDNSCARCIKTWLLAKARKELQLPPKKTNADHIRAMSDVELADLLYSRLNVDAEQIPFCKGSPKCETLLAQEEGVPDSMCLACMLKWLQEPWKRG